MKLLLLLLFQEKNSAHVLITTNNSKTYINVFLYRENMCFDCFVSNLILEHSNGLWKIYSTFDCLTFGILIL